jgi:hypothetical protein
MADRASPTISLGKPRRKTPTGSPKYSQAVASPSTGSSRAGRTPAPATRQSDHNTASTRNRNVATYSQISTSTAVIASAPREEERRNRSRTA